MVQSNMKVILPMCGGSHLFNGIEHHIPDDGDLLFLANADGPAEGLGLDGRVPLGLDDVYPGGDGEIEAKFASQHDRSEDTAVLGW